MDPGYKIVFLELWNAMNPGIMFEGVPTLYRVRYTVLSKTVYLPCGVLPGTSEAQSLRKRIFATCKVEPGTPGDQPVPPVATLVGAEDDIVTSPVQFSLGGFW